MNISFMRLAGGVQVRVRSQGRTYDAFRKTKRAAWNWVWALANQLEHDAGVDARLAELKRGRLAA